MKRGFKRLNLDIDAKFHKALKLEAIHRDMNLKDLVIMKLKASMRERAIKRKKEKRVQTPKLQEEAKL